jgi:hypothetical protein
MFWDLGRDDLIITNRPRSWVEYLCDNLFLWRSIPVTCLCNYTLFVSSTHADASDSTRTKLCHGDGIFLYLLG